MPRETKYVTFAHTDDVVENEAHFVYHLISSGCTLGTF